ncbi:Fruiting body protein SC7 [Rhizoctonia solani]|uniref:Fruiting body protein SC7 n=1 Tax=Rhizoctonia solani TaxID=456999 RepID=A0A0K6FMJ3_9AGAM|nr:Fruiting body protein SC7 [Rhizoctonia solani]
MTRFSTIVSVAIAAGLVAAAPTPVILHDRSRGHHAINARQNWGRQFASNRTRTRCTIRTKTQTLPAYTATPTSSPVATSLETIAYPQPTSEVPAPSSSVISSSSEAPQVTSSVLPATSTIVAITTQASSTAAAAATPSPKVTETSSGNAEIDAYLKGHNDIRAQHGASALTWATDLAAAAAKWAGNCVWEHSKGQVGSFGENLAAGTSLGAAAAVKMWTDEASEYNAANPQYSHFTQVVWKATTEVGCAVKTCNNILSGYSGAVNFHVCEYRSPGNVIGQFAQNVQA